VGTPCAPPRPLIDIQRARFGVFGSAEASVAAGGEAGRSGKQMLTLTLKPRMEMTVTDAQGRSVTTSRGVDVEGRLAAGEQVPPVPRP
jgi:hypothetical protein